MSNLEDTQILRREDLVDVDVDVDEAPATGSVLEAIVARRDELEAERRYDLHVPGYGGLLVMRCKPLTGRVLTALRSRHAASKSPERDVNLSADYLVNACEEFLGRRNVEDELVPLSEYDGGDPVGLGRRLVEMIHLNPNGDSARAVVFALFANAPSPDMAIEKMANDYAEWAVAANEEVGEELLGESRAARA